MWPLNPFATRLDSLRLLGNAARRFLLFSFLNTVSWQLLVGSVLVLHARALAIPSGVVGVVVSIMPFTLVLSLVVSHWVDRIGPRRMMTAGWTARNLMAFPLVLTPWIYAVWGSHAAGVALFTGVLCFCTMRSLTCAGWFPWLHEIVPGNERGRYFSMEIILVQVVNVGIGLGTFLFLGHHPALWKFGALSAVGIAAGLASISLMRRIPGGGPSLSTRRRHALVDLRLVLRDRSFMSYARWTSLGLFVTVGQNTLTVLSMRDYLHIAPAMIMFTTAMGSAAAMVAGPWWGRLADRHGTGPVQVLSGILMAIALASFALLRERTPLGIVIPVSAACVVAYSGFFVAANRGMLQRMRPALRAGYSAMWLSITSVAMGSSSVLVGLVVQHAGPHAYWGLCLAYSALIAMAVLRYATLHEESVGLAAELRSQFDPERPILSLIRLCRYVLNPPPAE
jgi:MFS family permease